MPNSDDNSTSSEPDYENPVAGDGYTTVGDEGSNTNQKAPLDSTSLPDSGNGGSCHEQASSPYGTEIFRSPTQTPRFYASSSTDTQASNSLWTSRPPPLATTPTEPKKRGQWLKELLCCKSNPKTNEYQR